MRSILIVEDDKTARYGIRRALEDRYKLWEAESAAAARKIMGAEPLDLLLLDIKMPEENGRVPARSSKQSCADMAET